MTQAFTNRSRRALSISLFLALVGLALGPQPAQAQMVPRSLEIDIFGGGYLFGGICPEGTTNRENLWCGAILGGRLGVNLNEHIAVEGSLGYVPTRTSDTGRTAHYLNPHFDVVLHMTKWRIVPYIAVGAGWQYTSVEEGYRNGTEYRPSGDWRDPYATAEDLSGNPPNAIDYPERSTNFIFDVGGGLKMLAFERGGVRVDARYVLSIGPGDPELVDATGDGVVDTVINGVPSWDANGVLVAKDVFHHAEITVAAFFLIGGGPGKDSDGDGIPDREDDCPDDREDRDEYQDEDGCPDLDNDQDGVTDTKDRCPMVPEDIDDWRDADGCPDPDNDGDGLQDGEDGCPSQAEDADGFQDADGCPDVDNDQDTIPDVRDGCPLEPEDADNFRDDDGCPEPDNDGDGIPDIGDRCPNAAEELNGIDDEDGCPEMDSDGDGVYDGADRCPGEVEDLDGFEDKDGCPDPDNDSDGLPDTQDSCPMVAEDPDGWEEGDGCPDYDNDEDGLPDAKDECPNKAEDDDGFEDKDGCPDLDNDQDGFVDGVDACPNHAETINGFQDKDGCPDEIPEDLKRFTGVIPDIQFKQGSDELLPSSFPTLNQAARTLMEYPDVRLEIQGHASAEGDDNYNLELSQRRADSVRRYLVAKGLDANRLIAMGYGETVPAATNRNESGRSINRRVEFHILQ
jgi:outer membrane protein OmpA-like peptidoglycan-associated protein